MRFDNLDERMAGFQERVTIMRERRRLCEKYESRMGRRTRSGRPFEEHRCRDMPYGYRIRRYGLPVDGQDWSAVAPFVWTVVRTETPDDWIEGDDYVGLMLGISASEPRFCPWCGDALGRAHELIRGWDGKTGIPTKEDFS